MTIGEMLAQPFPGNVNREGEVFRALVADGKGGGAIESVLAEAEAYAKRYTDTCNVYEQSGEMLDKTVAFFSFLKRFYDEEDSPLRRRLRAVLYRGGDTSWGSAYNIRRVFRDYFNTEDVFVLESTGDPEESLLEDGDFEDSGGTNAWVFSGGSSPEPCAAFSRAKGAFLPAEGGTVEQTVNVNPGGGKVFFLHWFMKGAVSVRIKDEGSGLYWDCASADWTDTDVQNLRESGGWENRELFFRLPQGTAGNIRISFSGAGCETYLDLVRLYLKKAVPSFSVVVHFLGEEGTTAMAVAEGNADAAGTAKPFWDYYNDSFLTGQSGGFAEDVYRELLEMVRPCGVRAYIEIVSQDYRPEDGE